jgi:hypothetical protein
MFPARFAPNQNDESGGGFVDDDMSGVPPSGFADDDGSGGSADEHESESSGANPDGES